MNLKLYQIQFLDLIFLLAHLTRRLIGELIVYPCSGVRPSSVRTSSTISKIFSETAGPIVLILHIHHLQVKEKIIVFFFFFFFFLIG